MRDQMISVKKRVLRNELTYEGKVLLTYKIEYPEFHLQTFEQCLLMLNRYYREQAQRYVKYCETVLYPEAVSQSREALANGFPVRAFEAVLSYTITYYSGCALSLYQDWYQFTGGAHGATTREAQTWNLVRCSKIRLRQLFPCEQGYKAFILDGILRQAALHPEQYFEDYPKRIADHFNKMNFYCTTDGIILFYQQYEIAPYASGILEFTFPYSDCVKNPADLCRF